MFFGFSNFATAQCTLATYGLYPDSPFISSCLGTNQTIVSDAYASEYSDVVIISNSNYTFSSSVTTDFITITNQGGTVVFASGTSPLIWNSGSNSGTIRYYLHANSSCGAQDTNRTKYISCQNATTICAPPTNLTTSNVFSTNAQLNWNAASPSPVSGYDVYFSTTNSVTPTTEPSGSVNGLTGYLNNIAPGTTYYFWVRSNCGNSMVSNWIAGPSFTTINPTGTGCITASYGLYPDTTYTPSCTGTNESIVTDAYAGEYSNVTVVANIQYTFTSSVETDFITISNANATVIYASGNSPLVWNSGVNSGVIRYFIHTNSNCASQNTSRTRFIKCQGIPQTCISPSNVSISNVFSTNVQLNWNVASPQPSAGYDVYYSTTNSISAGTVPIATVTGTSTFLSNLSPSTTYYAWIRSNCGNSIVSSWVSVPSFTTLANTLTGCTNAQYGLYPGLPFTPTCTGNIETITTLAYASEYSNINIIASKQYTFSSSVATDFVTITTQNGNAVLASGTSPLVWISGGNSGVIRYFLHTNSSCGSQNADRTKNISCQDAPAATCTEPSNLTASNLITTSAQLNWNAAIPAPSVGYDIYYSTTNSIAPTTIPIVTVSSGLLSVIGGLVPSTTYYYWIRSNCGDSMVSSWASGGSFMTAAVIGTGCVSAPFGLYPEESLTPNCTTSADVIVLDAYAGEYSNVVIAANSQYTFDSAITSDFISITNASGSVIYASGTTPLIWNSGANNGVVRYYIHVDSNCTAQDTWRIKTVSCSGGSSQTCNAPSNLTVSNLFTTNAQLNWNAASPSPSIGYDIYLSTTNTVSPTTTPSGTVNGLIGSLGGLSPSTTYYFWVRSNCGNSNVSNWIAGASFTTATPIGTGCITANYGLYPTTAFTPACSGSNETIVADAYAGEYSNINIVVNKQYTFTSSVATDFITISNANATVIYASGTTPLVWNSTTNTGVIRYYFHTNSNCIGEEINRTRLIKCSSTLDNLNFDKTFAKVYPNPTRDIVNVVGEFAFEKIIVLNNLGQKIKEVNSNLQHTQINIGNYASGIYFVKVFKDNKNQIYKIVKE